MIPRILHAWWGGPELPAEGRAHLSAWQELHPEWELKLWTPETTPTLRHQDLYDNPARFSPKSNVWQWRSDLARYEILLEEGGVYIDCDLRPLRPIDELITEKAFIAKECDRFVNNAFLGCEPGNAFMRDVVGGLRRSVLRQPRSRVNKQIGAHYLTGLLRKHPDVKVLPSELVYPAHWSDWQAAYADDAEYGDAFTVHEWWNKQRTEGVPT